MSNDCAGVAEGVVTLSERLRELRVKHGWKLIEQREAIKRTTGEDFAISYLSSLERGRQRSPGILALVRIAKGYGMCVQELLAPVSFDVEDNADPINHEAEAVIAFNGGQV